MDNDLQIGRLYLSLSTLVEAGVIQGVADCVNRLHFRAGETILREGDTLSALYYLAQGRVRADKSSVGEEKVFSYISAGYFLCEAAFFAKSANVGSLVAETACEIWSFSQRYVYEQLLSEHPEIALHIIRSLSVKMVGMYHHVNDLTVRQPEKALAQLLLPWVAEQGVRQPDGSYRLAVAPVSYTHLAGGGSHRGVSAGEVLADQHHKLPQSAADLRAAPAGHAAAAARLHRLSQPEPGACL